MALVDANRRLVDFNGAHLNLSGYRRHELVGQPAARFVVGKPLFTPTEWAAAIAAGDFTGEVPCSPRREGAGGGARAGLSAADNRATAVWTAPRARRTIRGVIPR